MTGLTRIALASLLALALPAVAACKQPDSTPAKSDASADKPAQSAPVSFKRETKAYTFGYEYPAQAAAIPALAKLLDAERADALAELEAAASEAQADAKANDYPFNPHSSEISWKVAGDTDAILALAGEMFGFSGGAHGNSNYDALLWDKAAGKRITLEALFTDAAPAMGLVRQPYCDALNAERVEKRGEYEATGDDMFEACPPFDELSILPYTGSDGRFDRLMLIAAPYVAGPYAEGVYEVTLPIPAAMRDLVKPQYRNAFSAAAR